VESYNRDPPVTDDGAIDKDKIAAGELKLALANLDLQEAANHYMDLVKRHIGNYTVNSVLGGAWMEGLSSPKVVNRVDAILQAVLQIPFDRLATTPMHVVMALVPLAQTVISTQSVSQPALVIDNMPQELKRKTPSAKQQQANLNRSQAGADKRLKAANTQTGPQQQSLFDLFYRKGNINTVTSSASTTDAPAIDGLKYFQNRELELDEHHQVELSGYQVGSLLEHFGDLLPNRVSLNGVELNLVKLDGRSELTDYNPTGLRLGLIYRLRGG
jgi:hypothetical protein